MNPIEELRRVENDAAKNLFDALTSKLVTVIADQLETRYDVRPHKVGLTLAGGDIIEVTFVDLAPVDEDFRDIDGIPVGRAPVGSEEQAVAMHALSQGDVVPDVGEWEVRAPRFVDAAFHGIIGVTVADVDLARPDRDSNYDHVAGDDRDAMWSAWEGRFAQDPHADRPNRVDGLFPYGRCNGCGTGLDRDTDTCLNVECDQCPADLECAECGLPMELDDNEVSHHIVGGQWGDGYDADANHVAFSELEDDLPECDWCGDPVEPGEGYNDLCGNCADREELIEEADTLHGEVGAATGRRDAPRFAITWSATDDSRIVRVDAYESDGETLLATFDQTMHELQLVEDVCRDATDGFVEVGEFQWEVRSRPDDNTDAAFDSEARTAFLLDKEDAEHPTMDDAKAGAWNDYQAALDRTLLVEELVVYTDDDEHVNVQLEGPTAVVVQPTDESDVFHTVDECVDPMWSVKVVDESVAAPLGLLTFVEPRTHRVAHGEDAEPTYPHPYVDEGPPQDVDWVFMLEVATDEFDKAARELTDEKAHITFRALNDYEHVLEVSTRWEDACRGCGTAIPTGNVHRYGPELRCSQCGHQNPPTLVAHEELDTVDIASRQDVFGGTWEELRASATRAAHDACAHLLELLDKEVAAEQEAEVRRIEKEARSSVETFLDGLPDGMSDEAIGDLFYDRFDGDLAVARFDATQRTLHLHPDLRFNALADADHEEVVVALPSSVPSRFKVDYQAFSGAGNAVVSEGTATVVAASVQDAVRAATEWVHDNDPYADPRIDVVEVEEVLSDDDELFVLDGEVTTMRSQRRWWKVRSRSEVPVPLRKRAAKAVKLVSGLPLSSCYRWVDGTLPDTSKPDDGTVVAEVKAVLNSYRQGRSTVAAVRALYRAETGRDYSSRKVEKDTDLSHPDPLTAARSLPR